MQTSFILNESEGRLPEAYNVLGMPVTLKIAGSDTQGQMSMFWAEYQKNQGPPLHLHNVDETFYITEGEFIFQTGDTRITATAGSTVFVPRNMPHAFLTISEIGKMLFMVNPTGNVEKVFEKLNEFQEMPSIAEVVRVHEELGFKIVGPPLTNE
ncbi:cupin domain-containing protein [Runella sp.]|uniref:cupin domain-containing protein n=1 Tax=Runella sp. TaxID=1960881 RepID=UPI003D1517A9